MGWDMVEQMTLLRVLKFSSTQQSQEGPPTIHAGLCVLETAHRWFVFVSGCKVWVLRIGATQRLEGEAEAESVSIRLSWSLRLYAESCWRKGWRWSFQSRPMAFGWCWGLGDLSEDKILHVFIQNVWEPYSGTLCHSPV